VNNSNQNNGITSGPLINNSNQNGSIHVPHSQSAHQIGHMHPQPTPLTPLAAHHHALQQQLQKHFANNNMGESRFILFPLFSFLIVSSFKTTYTYTHSTNLESINYQPLKLYIAPTWNFHSSYK
jgi:hypothetical protein